MLEICTACAGFCLCVEYLVVGVSFGTTKSHLFNLWLNALVEFCGELKYPECNKYFLLRQNAARFNQWLNRVAFCGVCRAQCSIIFLYSGIFDKFLQTEQVSFRLPSVFLPRTS